MIGGGQPPPSHPHPTYPLLHGLSFAKSEVANLSPGPELLPGVATYAVTPPTVKNCRSVAVSSVIIFDAYSIGPHEGPRVHEACSV